MLQLKDETLRHPHAFVRPEAKGEIVDAASFFVDRFAPLRHRPASLANDATRDPDVRDAAFAAGAVEYFAVSDDVVHDVQLTLPVPALPRRTGLMGP